MLREDSDPVSASRFDHWLDAAGVAGLFTYGFGILLNRNFNTAGIVMMAIPFCFRLKGRLRETLQDPLVVLGAVFFLFLALRTYFAALEFTAHLPDLIGGALKLFGTGFLLVYLIAYWLHKARGKWDLLFVVVLCGFLVQIIRKVDWSNLASVAANLHMGVQRATFGYATNRLGLFSAFILFGCVFLHRQMWGAPEIRRVWRWARVGYWAIMSALSAACLVFSQSRSAWAAAILVLPAALVFDLFAGRGSKMRRYVPVTVVAALVVAGLFTFNLAHISAQRLATGVSGQSVSDRLSIYEIAWDNWKSNPLLGRGPGTSALMIQGAGEKYDEVKKFDHLHNVFLDIAAQIGIVGVVFVGWSGFLIIRQAIRSYALEEDGARFVVFALGALAMVLITGMVNQPLHSPHGVHLAAYLGGICYCSKFADARPAARHPSN